MLEPVAADQHHQYVVRPSIAASDALLEFNSLFLQKHCELFARPPHLVALDVGLAVIRKHILLQRVCKQLDGVVHVDADAFALVGGLYYHILF